MNKCFATKVQFPVIGTARVLTQSEVRLNVLTSLLFVVPAAIALWAGMYFIAGLILTVTIASVIFHFEKERMVYWFDMIAACALMIFNFILLSLSHFEFRYTVFIVPLVIASFWFYKRALKQKYELNHSLWHITSVMITILCLLAFIQGH